MLLFQKIESLSTVVYASDLASTLFFLCDHFTAANAFMVGGHNRTISTLTHTITICCSVLFGTRQDYL